MENYLHWEETRKKPIGKSNINNKEASPEKQSQKRN